ncbi:hypothetical protein D9757_012131 [Collybiopsis confluens]|uniref:Protein kinase domain-containing protein n=1 Tax=Collybiopsis confluens TaxID=2823264 RepID=A0A8H5LQ83_9AGAR|nr:hypothetical protein D9757_012131 [Collybiopsis confluens]
MFTTSTITTINIQSKYVALYQADSPSLTSPTYQYFNYVQFNGQKALETFSEEARAIFTPSIAGGALHFFKLKAPIEIASLDEIDAKCSPFCSYAKLGSVGVRLSDNEVLDFGPADAIERLSVSMIIVWTPPLDPSQVATRPLTSSEEHPDAREAIARTAQGRPSPSTGAKSSELLTAQDMRHLDAAYNDRPPELRPPPLSIYHPVFSKFRQDMATPTETLHFTVDEIDRASRFIDVSLRHYPNKHARQEALENLPIINGEYWQTQKILINATSVEPDGGSKVRSKIGSDYGPYAYSSIAELKNGGGDGGSDPVDQVLYDYIKIVSSHQYKPIRLVSCCPAFLIGLSGHNLAVWGGVFADRFFFERLTLMYVGPQTPPALASPLEGRCDMEIGIREVAKLLRTLSTCIEILNDHYGSLSPLSPVTTSASTCANRPTHGTGVAPPPSPTLPYNSFDPSRFVHWKSFNVEGEQYTLVYHQRLTLWMEKTVFRAVMTADSNPKKEDVVVKFAHRYGEVGHRLLAEAGLAPRLYYCAFEKSVGMWVVVMQYVPGRICHGPLLEGEGSSLQQAINLLHAQDLVFGDLREPNVIISKPKRSVCLVDFEWCGSCEDTQGRGRVRYPTNISMNSANGWAEGVGPDCVIEKEHDIHRLTWMCSL